MIIAESETGGREEFWRTRLLDSDFKREVQKQRGPVFFQPRPDLKDQSHLIQAYLKQTKRPQFDQSSSWLQSIPEDIQIITYSDLHVERELGRGGFGVVFRGHLNGVLCEEVPVAVKKLL